MWDPIIEGCTTYTACNYDSTAAKDDGSCTYAEGTCDCDGNPTNGTCDCDGKIDDCAGDCGGNAVKDNCGTCDSDSSNDCVQDCAGVWEGSKEAHKQSAYKILGNYKILTIVFNAVPYFALCCCI